MVYISAQLTCFGSLRARTPPTAHGTHGVEQSCPTRGSRATFCPRHSVTLPNKTFEVIKRLLIFFVRLTKPKQNAKAILESLLFICGDFH